MLRLPALLTAALSAVDEVLNLSMHAICRADRGAVLHAAVGKVDFPVEHLYANLGALTAAILAARPKGIKGGGEHSPKEALLSTSFLMCDCRMQL